MQPPSPPQRRRAAPTRIERAADGLRFLALRPSAKLGDVPGASPRPVETNGLRASPRPLRSLAALASAWTTDRVPRGYFRFATVFPVLPRLPVCPVTLSHAPAAVVPKAAADVLHGILVIASLPYPSASTSSSSSWV